MKKLMLLTLVTLAAPVFGQTDKAILAKHWTATKELTIAVADAMPAEGYGSRPNEEEMSFGQLMIHIAVANNAAFATVAGEKAPAPPDKLSKWRDTPAVDKAAAMKFLTESFDYCLKTLDTLSADKLNAMTGPEGRQLVGYERIWSYFTHTAHHRGQAEVYLRVKNIKPPTYKF
jgi:uncharacterized damage-inducible protein DinB